MSRPSWKVYSPQDQLLGRLLEHPPPIVSFLTTFLCLASARLTVPSFLPEKPPGKFSVQSQEVPKLSLLPDIKILIP